jgi:PAS domain S-box-containing protein
VLVAHAFELMTVVTENGVIAFREPEAVERVTGYQSQERIGRSLFEFVHPDDAGRMRAAFDYARAKRKTPLLEFRARHRDGEWLPLESVVRFIGGGERVVYGLVHARDVRERHDLQSRLRHAQKLTTLGRLTVSLAFFAAIVATIRTHCTLVEHRWRCHPAAL